MGTAMEQEAAPLIEGLHFTKDNPSKIAKPAPCSTYSGSYAGLDVTVVCNGESSIVWVCQAESKLEAGLASCYALPEITRVACALLVFCLSHYCQARLLIYVLSMQASAASTMWTTLALSRPL